MTMVATEVGTVPAAGFNWYLILLEGPFSDEIHDEIDRNFLTLGKEVGRDALVVRGYDPTGFRKSFELSDFFYAFSNKWDLELEIPSLIVTDKSPSLTMDQRDELEQAKVMFFPLGTIYHEQGTVVGFLTDLVEALKDREAVEALDRLDKPKIEKWWGWLSKYVTLEVNLFICTVHVNAVVKDIIGQLRK